ncbi:MAG TPA: hypothetical protein VF841_07095 [Anaeromyxobacter sp.]
MRFTQAHLTIGALETPVAAPVTVGSAASPRTMQSDRPDVLSIDEWGRFVPHAEGRANVRSFDRGSYLVVDVIVPRSLRVDPPIVRLRLNESANVRVLTEAGKVVPPDAISWWSSALRIASATKGVVRGGSLPGNATIEARFGSASGKARVEIAGPPDVSFVVSPERPRLRVGEVLSFEARSPDGPLDPEWSSDEQRVVTRLQANVFWAAAAGKTRVCARNGNRCVCTSVEVMP